MSNRMLDATTKPKVEELDNDNNNIHLQKQQLEDTISSLQLLLESTKQQLIEEYSTTTSKKEEEEMNAKSSTKSSARIDELEKKKKKITEEIEQQDEQLIRQFKFEHQFELRQLNAQPKFEKIKMLCRLHSSSADSTSCSEKKMEEKQQQPHLKVSEDKKSFTIVRPTCSPSSSATPTTTEQEQKQEKSYSFDEIFISNKQNTISTTNDIFEKHISSLLEKAVDGHNVAVFTIGDRNCMQSSTMISSDFPSSSLYEKNAKINLNGIIPRSFKRIFDLFDYRKNTATTTNFPSKLRVQCQVIEAYRENLIDLLNPNYRDVRKYRDNIIASTNAPVKNNNPTHPTSSSSATSNISPVNIRLRQKYTTSGSTKTMEASSSSLATSEANSLLPPVPAFQLDGNFARECENFDELMETFQTAILNSVHMPYAFYDGLHDIKRRETELIVILTLEREFSFLPSCSSSSSSTCEQQQQHPPLPKKGFHGQISQLIFIDFAGFERRRKQPSTSPAPVFPRVSAHDNSLATLFRCIDGCLKDISEIEKIKNPFVTSENLLTCNKSDSSSSSSHRMKFVPYRDSKITMILRDCLENGLLCCISCFPASETEAYQKQLETTEWIARLLSRVHPTTNSSGIESRCLCSFPCEKPSTFRGISTKLKRKKELMEELFTLRIESLNKFVANLF